MSPRLYVSSGCDWRRLPQDVKDSCCTSLVNAQFWKAVKGWSASLRVGGCAEVTTCSEKPAWYKMLYTNFKKCGRSMQWIHLG